MPGVEVDSLFGARDLETKNPGGGVQWLPAAQEVEPR